jgi:hypothetical protein
MRNFAKVDMIFFISEHILYKNLSATDNQLVNLNYLIVEGVANMVLDFKPCMILEVQQFLMSSVYQISQQWKV